MLNSNSTDSRVICICKLVVILHFPYAPNSLGQLRISKAYKTQRWYLKRVHHEIPLTFVNNFDSMRGVFGLLSLERHLTTSEELVAHNLAAS